MYCVDCLKNLLKMNDSKIIHIKLVDAQTAVTSLNGDFLCLFHLGKRADKE